MEMNSEQDQPSNGEKQVVGTIEITEYIDGTYEISRESGEEEASEEGMPGESMGVEKKMAGDARELVMMIKSMVNESAGASAQAAFDSAGSEDAASKPMMMMKKGGM